VSCRPPRELLGSPSRRDLRRPARAGHRVAPCVPTRDHPGDRRGESGGTRLGRGRGRAPLPPTRARDRRHRGEQVAPRADPAAVGGDRSVDVVVAASAAAPASRGRAETTEVGRLAGGGRACGDRHEPLQLPAAARGAGDGCVTPDESLELRVAGRAAICVDGHGRRLARDPRLCQPSVRRPR
jgi:hypothetical protein